MISPVSGEIHFSEGVYVSPHELLIGSRVSGFPSEPFSLVTGWTKYLLGIRESEYGSFEVEVVADESHRVQTVALTHIDSSYQPDTPEDAERRSFHESIIATDLHGQREFSWGEVLCCLDPEANRDWLVIVYSADRLIPRPPPDRLRHLFEHEPEPRASSLV